MRIGSSQGPVRTNSVFYFGKFQPVIFTLGAPLASWAWRGSWSSPSFTPTVEPMTKSMEIWTRYDTLL